VNREPGVLRVFRLAHLHGKLQLVCEGGGGLEGLPGVLFPGLSFGEQLAQDFELSPELIDSPGRLQLPVEPARLAQDFLGLFGA
jgi:hypothetical protein